MAVKAHFTFLLVFVLWFFMTSLLFFTEPKCPAKRVPELKAKVRVTIMLTPRCLPQIADFLQLTFHVCFSLYGWDRTDFFSILRRQVKHFYKPFFSVPKGTVLPVTLEEEE